VKTLQALTPLPPRLFLTERSAQAVEFFYVSPVAFTKGEPARLYSGVDYLGNVCGLAKAQQSVHVDRGLQMDTTGTPNWYAFNLITDYAAPVAVVRPGLDSSAFWRTTK
jgi:hypothetical protein